ncbi:enoyl-CoA hydratase/isomerase family protein [Haloarchaeobius sp. HRN-SO-5]|uniref:enoyl-CoA hydratase/isomerase family protein n=1 Tax=Haloarchaeobius sp. HRN-SO-5 TaxID=3446118 RepID=UPI003EBD0AA5
MVGIDVDVADHVATLTIRNPEKRNAIAPSFLPDLAEELDDLESRDDVRCLVVTGAGAKAFSSGFDLSELDGDAFQEEYEDVYDEAFTRLARFDYPTIARINGDAVGGGFDLATACDLRVAADRARFGIPTARIGLVYTERAIRQTLTAVGAANAKELLFTADLVDAERAEEMGLLNDRVPAAELDDRVDDLAERIASNAPLSLVGTKRIVQGILDKQAFSPAERALVERLREEAYQSDDYDEGRAAVSDDREPEFTGE